MQMRSIGLGLVVLMLMRPALAADFPVGRYAAGKSVTLAFDTRGGFQVTQDGKVMVSGQYKATGDSVEFTDQSGPWACTGKGTESGTYHWQSDAGSLTLTKLSDACEDRVGSLVNAEWKRQGG